MSDGGSVFSSSTTRWCPWTIQVRKFQAESQSPTVTDHRSVPTHILKMTLSRSYKSSSGSFPLIFTGWCHEEVSTFNTAALIYQNRSHCSLHKPWLYTYSTTELCLASLFSLLWVEDVSQSVPQEDSSEQGSPLESIRMTFLLIQTHTHDSLQSRWVQNTPMAQRNVLILQMFNTYSVLFQHLWC